MFTCIKWMQFTILLISITNVTAQIFIVWADSVCSAEIKNLGTSFATPTDCALAALNDAQCTSNKIMWSQYSWSWGCRCCTPTAVQGSYNVNWDVYQFPTPQPTLSPTIPTTNPTITPTNPTKIPTNNPTVSPTNIPTETTMTPSINPSMSPTMTPSITPIISPTQLPTITPSRNPSISPVDLPTNRPTNTQPTLQLTGNNNHKEIMETTLVTKYIKVNITNNKTSNNKDIFWPIIISLLIIICCCVLCLVFMIKRKLQKEVNKEVMSHNHTHLSINKRNNNNDNIGEGNSDNTHTIPMKNESVQDTNSSRMMEMQNELGSPDIKPVMHVTPMGLQGVDKALSLMVKPNMVILPSISIDSQNFSEQKASHISNDNNVFMHIQNEELIKIKNWLCSFKMQMYYNVFVANGYESMDIIKAIESRTDLLEIGIELRGHQTKLLSEIKKLKPKQRYDIEFKENENETDEGTNEDITDPPTEEGDTPNDESPNDNETPNEDGNGSSDIMNDNDNMQLLYEKNTKQYFGIDLQNNVMANELLMDDVIEDMNVGDQTPQ